MKQYCLSIILILFCFVQLAYGQCGTTVITLSNQNEVDAFRSMLPVGCTEVANLTVRENGTPAITNLDSLYFLTSVENTFSIVYCPSLSKILDFNNLTYARYFEITHCDLIDTISGFQNLESVDLNFEIGTCQNLKLISGFSSLDTVLEEFFIVDNDQLTTIEGFDNLRDVGIEFVIESNQNLFTINAFHNLISVGESFNIFMNNALLAIDGFNNLVSCDYVYLLNDEVITISGFNKFENGFINIYANQKLEEISGFNATSSSFTKINIELNYILTTISGFNGLTHCDNLDMRLNPLLNEVSGFQSITSLGRLDLKDHDNLESLDFLRNIEFISGDFIITNTGLLTNLDDFQSLASLEGSITITNNLALNSYCGLFNAINSGNYTNYTVSGNGSNPSSSTIISEGPCGFFGLGGNTFLTLSEALEAALSGQTIRTIRSSSQSGHFTIPLDQTLQISISDTLTIQGSLLNNGMINNKSVLDIEAEAF